MSNHGHAEATSIMEETPHGTDGTLGKMMRFRKPKHTVAIFIHAGAGFHSPQNERTHLEACSSASEMGMRFLKAGSTATESVEAALRILENIEITNAGYGSNLSIDGTVECDATIVDHLGRSGACGAVPGVRNPISLAKLILDTSNKPLSLRRVPPNALVGEGARIFAEEHGIVTCPNEHLVSKNARDRFIRWQMDLHRAEGNARDPRTIPTADQGQAGWEQCRYDTVLSPQLANCPLPRDHGAAILAATWNEGQPDTPNYGPQESATHGERGTNGAVNNQRISATTQELAQPQSSEDSSKLENGAIAIVKGSNLSQSIQSPHDKGASPETCSLPASTNCDEGIAGMERSNPSEDVRYRSQWDGVQHGSPAPSGISPAPRGVKRPHRQVADLPEAELANSTIRTFFRDHASGEDFISDTVGAIAVDENGNIAAGSSSGGIGMKHRGRLGPAALVGVGTAVVPCSKDDPEGITVASVTSGTGEHMVTTMASQKCAERIYHGTRKEENGEDVHDDDEDAIMESFVLNDFMNHAGVKNCHSAAAIGVMAVKKTQAGYYLYFAHNTDSFALASMGGSDKLPVCTMSRLPKGATIAKGGLKVRVD